jgi:hypothetical protein
MSIDPRTLDLLQNLATRPGHDEVKADFRALLVEEFGVDLRSLDFERRVPEVRGRLDALIGRTVLEAKSSGPMSHATCHGRSPSPQAAVGPTYWSAIRRGSRIGT